MTEDSTRTDRGAEDALLRRRAELSILDPLAREGRLYAVVDTAGDQEAYSRLVALGPTARCLYAGELGARYAAIAPWLVQVDAATNAWLGARPAPADDPTTTDWGVYVVSRAGLDAVARQLRRWLTVRLPDGGRVRFRFYDPRVLPPFLRESTAPELDAFYGRAIDAFAVPDHVTQALDVYTRAAAPVVLPTRRLQIAPPRQVAQSAGAGDGRPPAPLFPLGPATRVSR